MSEHYPKVVPLEPGRSRPSHPRGENYRRAIHLKREGWSYKGIAGLLGISENRVGQLLAKARKSGDL